MEKLVKKYAQKLIKAGLAEAKGPDIPLVGGLDDRLTWNRDAPETRILENIFKALNINSLVFLRPPSPYADLLAYLTRKALAGVRRRIEPKDCETRTFLHDLPVIPDLDADRIIQTLKSSKSVIVGAGKSGGVQNRPAIIAHGTVSPEQGFVTVSSVCFACFVKFFTDFLDRLKNGNPDPEACRVFDRTAPLVKPLKTSLPHFIRAPFQTEKTVYSAVMEAGRQTVEYGLVDSYFGNVSYLWKNTLYISQTGSSLDELAGCIDPVPMDGSSSAGLTASSELTAHVESIKQIGCRAILHGHPRFSVIMSMDCDPAEKAKCPFSTQCHIQCPQKRQVAAIPIVPGEVGTGPTGLCNTLPPALEKNGNAIVYGHGVFTTGKQDFAQAFQTMLEIESRCRIIYFEKVAALRKKTDNIIKQT